MKRILPVFCALLVGCALAAADLLSGAKVVGEAGNAELKTVNGKPALVMTGSTANLKGATNRYLTARIQLPRGVSLKGKSVSFKVTGSTSGQGALGLYFRAFERPADRKPVWSYKKWGMRLSDRPQSIQLTAGRASSLEWEPKEVVPGTGAPVTTLKVFLGSPDKDADLKLVITDLEIGPARDLVRPGTGSFSLPQGFWQELGGVTRTGYSFAKNAQEIPASSPNAFAFNYNRAQGKYSGLMFFLKKPIALEGKALNISLRGDQPAKGLYVRFYNKGAKKPVWSLCSWSMRIPKTAREYRLQRGGADGFNWETAAVDADAKADNIDRIEIIIGEQAASDKTFDLEIGGVRIAEPTEALTALNKVTPLLRKIDLTGKVTILHPDTPAGKAAAQTVAAVLPQAEVRPGTAADRGPIEGDYIMLGSIFTNPAMLTLYARRQLPADESFPGKGKYFVSAVPEAFHVGQSVIGVGTSDDTGLALGARALAEAIRKADKKVDAALFLTNREVRKLPADHIERGLKIAQQRLDNGTHTSLGGYLATIGIRYILDRQSADAKLYAEVCRMYAKSAVADSRKFGGAWGFDSDFMSFDALNGYDAIEHDPILTDADRLDITRCLARWLEEAIAAEARGGLTGTAAVHNHLTFCSQGTLVGGYYFRKYYPKHDEPKRWEAIARHNFGRQTPFAKAIDDCNGYQWHVWHHVLNYTLTTNDETFFRSGAAEKVMRGMLITMDNYGLQVPYGDTGSWKCWLNETAVLQEYLAAQESPLARYILSRKRKWNMLSRPNSYFAELGKVTAPEGFFGVQKIELDPAYYRGFADNGGQPIEKCFDKLSMRDSFDPQGFYLMIDGVNNGNHKHADGNSIPRHTQFDRIWLADNDYFKSQQKFHNTLLLIVNGEAGQMKPYIEFLGMGDDDKFGWYAGRSPKLAGTADWTRCVVWFKRENAYAVLDMVQVDKPASLLLKQRWNGVGDIARKADGAVLTQRGPAMRYQGPAASRYALADDYELGMNWTGYPHASKVIRVVDQIREAKLDAGGRAFIGGVWHGAADGKVAPWRVTDVAGGMKVDTGERTYTITVKPDGTPEIAEGASDGPVAETAAADQAGGQVAGKAFRELWLDRKSRVGQFYYTSPEYFRDFPYELSGTESTMPNALIGDAPNKSKALVDGSWDGADDSIMLAPDQVGDWTLTFRKPQTFTSLKVCSWWANASSRGTKHLLKTIDVYVDGKKVATRDLSGEKHPNFGRPVEFELNFKSVTGKTVRVVITPRAGSRAYLCEILPGGPTPVNVRIPNLFEEYTASAKLGSDLLTGTANGLLRRFAPDGRIRWEKELKCGRIHDIHIADLKGSGKPEILIACDNDKFMVLDQAGNVLWEHAMPYYRVKPAVTILRTADIDGDGKLEILAGCDNWRTYAISGDGRKVLWHYEVVHPTRAVTVADLDGDGKPEILCGTKYYSMSVLNNDGRRVWAGHFGPGCRAIETATGADGVKRVAAASDDGRVYFFSAKGKKIANFNTGDEVRVLAVTGNKGAQTVWAGSFNGYVYSFTADGRLRHFTAVPGEVTALKALPDGSALAGTSEGAVVKITPDGKVAAHAKLGGAVSSLTVLDGRFGVTTRNGEAAEFAL